MRIYHYYGIDEDNNIRPFEVMADNDQFARDQADKMPLKMITYTWSETIDDDDYFKEVQFMKKVNRTDTRKTNPLKYRPIQGPRPPKKTFKNKYGFNEECECNGMEIYDSLGDCWWNEYVDSCNDFHYGR